MILRAAGLALAVLLLSVPAAGAQGGLGFRASAEGPMPQAGYLAFGLAAGGTANGAFTVTNTASSAATVSVYPADALTGVTTGIVYGTRSDTSRAGGWITPDRTAATIPANGETVIRFTVRVPGGAAAGEHVGSVVVQQQRSGSAAVAQVMRVVAPVLVEVPGGGGPQIQLESARPVGPNRAGASFVTLGLRNAGGRRCSPEVSTTLSGPGESGRTTSRQLDVILPRDVVTYPMPWPRPLATGQYRISVTASGCGATQTRTFTDTLPGGGEDGVGGLPGDKDGTERTRKRRVTTTERVPVTARRPAAAAPDITLQREPTTAAPAAEDGGSGLGAGAGAGAGEDRDGASGGLADTVRKLVEENAGEALRRAGAPMALLLVFGLVVVAQEAVDRRDPKLRLAPVHREPDLAFGPDPDTANPNPVGHASNQAPDLRVRQ